MFRRVLGPVVRLYGDPPDLPLDRIAGVGLCFDVYEEGKVHRDETAWS